MTDACAAGLAREVAELFREHGSLVERALRRGGVAERDLSDAQQEVFIVVLRKLAGFERRSSVSTWLYAIAMRVASDFRRKAHRRREQLGGERSDSCEPDALGALEQRERLTQVLHLIDALPPQQREVLVLHELFELSMAEVAARLRCPLKTAFSRLYAARRQLLSELRARGELMPLFSGLLSIRKHLRAGSHGGSSASASWGASHALGALAAACLLLPGPPGLRTQPAPARAAIASAAQATRPQPPSPSIRKSRPTPQPVVPRPRAARRLAPQRAVIEPAAAGLAASTNPADDGLQLVWMGAIETAPGIEHPWMDADGAQPSRRTPTLRLRGPRDPADELERALSASP